MGTLFEWVGFLDVGWKDLFEVLLVAYLIYRILLLWTGTRALQIFFGVVLLVAVYAVARLLDLGLITYILSQLFTYGVFAAIVVFQPELRNALAQLGRSRFWRVLAKMEGVDVAEEIATAAERLSRAKIGAIIAIERDVGLGEYTDTGTPISARVSADLIATIFTPYSPLHDGAVVIRGDQIVAAGCILPLTQFPISDRSLGTRHRAALGLSEETDAYVVVVSEETSQVSLAHRGVLRRGLDAERLRARLGAERDVVAEGEERRVAEKAAALPGTEEEEVVTTERPPPEGDADAEGARGAADGEAGPTVVGEREEGRAERRVTASSREEG